MQTILRFSKHHNSVTIFRQSVSAECLTLPLHSTTVRVENFEVFLISHGRLRMRMRTKEPRLINVKNMSLFNYFHAVQNDNPFGLSSKSVPAKTLVEVSKQVKAAQEKRKNVDHTYTHTYSSH